MIAITKAPEIAAAELGFRALRVNGGYVPLERV